MFFIGLTASLIFIISGIVLIINSSIMMGSILLGAGLFLFIVLLIYYRKRNRKKEKDGLDCLDCGGGAFDCPSLSSMKKMDCDCDGDKGFDCDCTPDCSS